MDFCRLSQFLFWSLSVYLAASHQERQDLMAYGYVVVKTRLVTLMPRLWPTGTEIGSRAADFFTVAFA